jgi:hypothetical protein
VKTPFIEPGSPAERGYCESFNSKLRDELLNAELFSTLYETEVLIESWRRHCNAVRPHSSLGYSPDRRGEHPEHHLQSFAGILQADAYAGFNKLYDGARPPGPVTEAGWWAHGRRKFFELADPALSKRSLLSPVALEAVKRIDTVFAIERVINGQPAEARLAVR